MPCYGALSTDIKKSSANWTEYPDWMKKAVQYCNNITEAVFVNRTSSTISGKSSKIGGRGAMYIGNASKHPQLILPNSPEGDAYTFYLEHENQDTLKEMLIRMAMDIQYCLKQGRGKDKYKNPKPLTAPGREDNEKEYLGQIYLRIGIAVSDDPSHKPLQYEFSGQPSYRGGVIRFAEMAEERDDWQKPGVNIWNQTVEFQRKNNVREEVVKESFSREVLSEGYEGTYLGYELITDDGIGLLQKTHTDDKSVEGVMIFIAYKFGITDELYNSNPVYYREYKEQEFKRLHDMANAFVWSITNGENTGKGQLVKVKRDSSSMFYVPIQSDLEDDKKLKKLKRILQKMSLLVALLPFGGSIGISYATEESKKLTQVTRTTFDGKEKTDYFGNAVNVAARMENAEWTYATKYGNTVAQEHGNRVSFGFYGTEQDIRDRILRDDTNAVSAFDIPLDALNVGEGKDLIHVLSRRVRGIKLQEYIGKTVSFYFHSSKRTGEVISISLSTGQAYIKGTLELSIYLCDIEKIVSSASGPAGVESKRGNLQVSLKF